MRSNMLCYCWTRSSAPHVLGNSSSSALQIQAQRLLQYLAAAPVVKKQWRQQPLAPLSYCYTQSKAVPPPYAQCRVWCTGT